MIRKRKRRKRKKKNEGANSAEQRFEPAKQIAHSPKIYLSIMSK